MTSTKDGKPPALPEDLGPYRIQRWIGGGGMGEVYLAYDQRLDRRVAIKRLRHKAGADPKHTARSVARFRREARAVARLSHPSIVQIYDLLEDPEGDRIVMEHVAGPTLAEQVRRGPLPLHEVLDYGRAIAEGLAEAHDRGIVHRDLKAENVVISPAGQAKILDFGLARDLQPEAPDLTHSEDGMLRGTPRTMAPEQARGLPAGPKADLFSLGVLLYETLTGRTPFGGATPAETLSRVLTKAPAPLPEELPARLRHLVQQLLEKAPELRPADSRTVAEQLRNLRLELLGNSEPAPSADHAETELSIESVPASGTVVRGPWLRLSLLGLLIASVAIWGSWRLADGASRQQPSARGESIRETAARGDSRTSDGRSAAAGLEDSDWTEASDEELLTAGTEALVRYEAPGQIDRAIAVLLLLIERSPDSAMAHALLSRAYWRKLVHDSGDRMWLDQALAVARRAVFLDPGLAEARVSLGLALIQAGELDEARSELKRAPELAAAHLGLAEIHRAQGQIAEEERELLRAQELAPNDRALQDYLGTFYYRQGRLDEAESAFRQSIALAPQTIYGYRNLAAVLYARGQLAAAGTMIARALEIRPSPSLYNNYGVLLFAQGLYPQAATAFEAALQLPAGANSYTIHASLGDTYRQIPHRLAEAPSLYRQAIRLLSERLQQEPENVGLRSQMAVYRARSGDREGALDLAEAIEEASAAETADPRSLFRLTLAYEALGERDRALSALQRALVAGFPHSEVAGDPELLSLRADRRYHTLAAQLTTGDG